MIFLFDCCLCLFVQPFLFLFIFFSWSLPSLIFMLSYSCLWTIISESTPDTSPFSTSFSTFLTLTNFICLISISLPSSQHLCVFISFLFSCLAFSMCLHFSSVFFNRRIMGPVEFYRTGEIPRHGKVCCSIRDNHNTGTGEMEVEGDWKLVSGRVTDRLTDALLEERGSEGKCMGEKELLDLTWLDLTLPYFSWLLGLTWPDSTRWRPFRGV